MHESLDLKRLSPLCMSFKHSQAISVLFALQYKYQHTFYNHLHFTTHIRHYIQPETKIVRNPVCSTTVSLIIYYHNEVDSLITATEHTPGCTVRAVRILVSIMREVYLIMIRRSAITVRVRRDNRDRRRTRPRRDMLRLPSARAGLGASPSPHKHRHKMRYTQVFGRYKISIIFLYNNTQLYINRTILYVPHFLSKSVVRSYRS